MRVAFVQQPWESGFPPRSSIGIWTYRVAKRLLVMGAEVRIYAGIGQRRETLEGIEYLETPAPLDPYRHALFKRLNGQHPRRPFIGSPHYHQGYARGIGKSLASWKPDIIQLHNFSQFVPLLRRQNPSARVVLHMHCEWLSQLDPAWIAPRIAQTDAVIGCSQHVSELVRSAFPQYRARIHTVYNGTEMGAAQSLKSEPTILYVGRISPEKGVHVLLEAFEQVLKTMPQARLKLVGLEQVPPPEYLIELSGDPKVKALRRFYPGSYLEQIKAKMSPKAKDRTEFLGFVPYAELPKLYGQARVLVNPALSEAFGMSLAEAMAGGVAVVASRVGGMSEVVQEGESGLLVEPENPKALAEALLTLLQDPDLARSMGTRGRARASQLFNWDTIAEQTWALYKQIC